ncbi:MAG: GNAT family N-acetyltransferase, partial [Oscillospiraceae bacterium]|nr:GNAT family N-acetyltransferase [Oscillospiraceae bacterium]
KETYAVTVKNVLSDKETCAVTVKNDDTAIGSVGLLIGSASNLSINDNEAEIGYWIAEPFWGRGYIPEAVRELIRYAFEELNISKLWCGYFDGNVKSKRVNEKCGFKFHHTEFDREWSLINAVKTQHITCFCKEDWNQNLSKRTAK